MKKTLLLLSTLTLASCNCSTSSTDSANTKDAVMQTDKDFNDYCAKHGQAAAFIKYADSSQISMGENSLPIMGIEKLKESFSKRHDTISKLTWEPSKGEASGDLGYTFGWWKFYTKTAIGKDTIYQGVYVTVWKKQKDGSWKYVLDGGNDTPAHTN
jgi:ketosteroid isomerase-like protein